MSWVVPSKLEIQCKLGATNNGNTHIDQYLKKQRESGNEIWSVNRIKHDKHFSRKNHAQSVVEKLFPDPFLKNQN